MLEHKCAAKKELWTAFAPLFNHKAVSINMFPNRTLGVRIWMLHPMNMKKHTSVPIPIKYCPFCGKELNND